MKKVMMEGLDNIRDTIINELVKKGKENWAGLKSPSVTNGGKN